MINLNFTSIGNKNNPALVFLHGFLGSGQDWQELISSLKDDYYCLAFDLPGHGESIISENYSGITLESFSSDFYAFLKTLNLFKPVLVGYSMGGRIGMHLLRNDDFFWQGAILESVSPGIENLDERVARFNQDLKLTIKIKTTEFRNFLIWWYDQPLFSEFKKSSEFNRIFEQRLMNSSEQLAQSMKIFSVGRQQSFWHMFDQFAMPILIISGSEDKKYKTITKQIARNYPEVQIEIVPGAGHVVHSEKPQEFVTLLSRFLINLDL